MSQTHTPLSAAVVGPWHPLRTKIFRNLLLADLVSDMGTFMQSVAAAWLMTTLTRSTLLIALIQAASAAPYFLLALPAGSIGDIVDRRKLILCTETWMVGVAVILTIATGVGAMTPWLLLALTVAMSFGDAIESPTWRAIFPELIKKEDLSAALALNGIEFNLARAIGPGLAGLIVAASGARTAFALDAISFAGVIYVIARWRRPARKSDLPPESFRGASIAAVRFVRYSPGIRSLLLRTICLVFFVSSFWALLPSVARGLGKGPLSYGLLLGFFGAGAVLGAVVLQRARALFRLDAIVSAATLVFGVVIFGLAELRSVPVLCALMLLGGSSWTVFMSLFNTMIQNLAPDWVRARVLAFYVLAFQGGIVFGSMLWGFVAERASAHFALLCSAAGIILTIALQLPLPLPNTSVDLSAWQHWRRQEMFAAHPPDAGPVLVTVQYVVNPEKTAEFLNAMHRYERVRRRNGAMRWGIFYDTTAKNVFLESFIVHSWAEHQRQHARFTVADHEIEKQVLAYTIEPTTVRHYIYAHRSAVR
jgi:MFS family permease